MMFEPRHAFFQQSKEQMEVLKIENDQKYKPFSVPTDVVRASADLATSSSEVERFRRFLATAAAHRRR